MRDFLSIPPDRHVASNDLAFAIRDAFPVTEGHTLVIPRRPIASLADATPDERLALLSLVDAVRRDLDAHLAPDAYNIGLNDGPAAGQTIPHLHLHVIPRHLGDVDDPTGGVRLVIPSRGNHRRPGHIPTPTNKTR